MSNPKNPGPGPRANGSKSNGVKPTNLQLEQRITEVEMLLSLGSRRTQIHAAMDAKYRVDWRTTDRYISRAKRNLLKRTELSKADHLKNSLNFYEAIVFSPTARASDRIMARKRFDELLGLDAPRRTEVSGPEGAPIAFGEVKVYVPAKRPLVPVGDDDVKLPGGNGERGNGEAG